MDRNIEFEIQQAFPAHSIMVVLIDDQPMVGESVRRMLEDEPDINLHFCREADKALETIINIHPTLILQDVVMPEVDGLELVQTYRSNPKCQDVPIVVLSARDDPNIKARAFAYGANDYIVKLPDKVELIARIRYHAQWYINKLQRDEAFKSLRESQRQLEELNLELYKTSSQDWLTGIMNRRRLDEVLINEWQRAQREKLPLSIIMIDLDFFKSYNDILGHIAGDECLKTIARILAESLKRATDSIARYGGEEFVAVLSNTDIKGAAVVAETMRRKVEEAQLTYPKSKGTGLITISLGVATTIPSPECSFDSLINDADVAMYQSKKAGRNRITIQQRME